MIKDSYNKLYHPLLSNKKLLKRNSYIIELKPPLTTYKLNNFLQGRKVFLKKVQNLMIHFDQLVFTIIRSSKTNNYFKNVT